MPSDSSTVAPLRTYCQEAFGSQHPKAVMQKFLSRLVKRAGTEDKNLVLQTLLQSGRDIVGGLVMEMLFEYDTTRWQTLRAQFEHWYSNEELLHLISTAWRLHPLAQELVNLCNRYFEISTTTPEFKPG
jgi:hypothetical protein